MKWDLKCKNILTWYFFSSENESTKKKKIATTRTVVRMRDSIFTFLNKNLTVSFYILLFTFYYCFKKIKPNFENFKILFLFLEID